jgi:hypothetical protein
MKKNQLVKLAITSLALTLAACSGGGGRRANGKRCPLNYDPYPMDIPADQKIDLAKPLPAGSYEYNGASLFYRNPALDFKMELHDSKQRDGSFKGTQGCVRNAVKERIGKAMSTEGISKMVIDQGSGKVTSDVKNFGFLILEDGKVHFDFVKSNHKVESPSELFTGKVKNSFMFKRSEAEYEIRSYGVNEDMSEFYLVVRYIKN